MEKEQRILYEIGRHVRDGSIAFSDVFSRLLPGVGDSNLFSDIGKVFQKLACYYVYAFEKDGKMVYVGVGTKVRVFQHYRDPESPVYWHLQRDELRPLIFASGLKKMEAYDLERELIDKYRDQLINQNDGLAEPPNLSVTRKKIMGMIAGFFEMAGALPFTGKEKARDMIALLTILCTCYKCGKTNGIAMSERRMAESIGMWKTAARNALHSLMEKSIIVKSRNGYCRESNSYDITMDEVFPMWSPLCTNIDIDIDFLLRVIGHDAFRQRALGKHALLVYLYCHLHPDIMFRVQQIADAVGISTRVVYKCLEPLLEYKLIVREKRWYRANPFFRERKLDDIAKRYRTNGIGEAAASHFYRERSAHVASLLRNRGFECGEDGLSFIVKQIVTEAQRHMSIVHKVKRVFNDLRGFRLIPAPLVNAVPSSVMRC